MAGSYGAQLVRDGVYQPPGRAQRKKTYLKLSFLPFMLALYLYTPAYKLGRPDRPIEAAHRWRTVLAVVIAVSTTVPYLGTPNADKVTNALFGDLFTTGMFLVPLFLVAVAILVFSSNPRWRADTVRQLLRPLGTMGAFTLTYVIFGAMMGLGYLDALQTWHPLAAVLGALFLLWYIVYLIFAAFLAARHLFNAVDGNLLLPPLFAALVSWWLIVQRLIFQSEFKPLWLDLLLALGGALAMTALSAWEVFRLARRGVTLGSGPYPPLPQPQPYPQPPSPVR